MGPGVDDEGADPRSWGHVSCCDHWQPLLVLAAPTVHRLSKHSCSLREPALLRCIRLWKTNSLLGVCRIPSSSHCRMSLDMCLGVLGLETDDQHVHRRYSSPESVSGNLAAKRSKTTTLQCPRCFASSDLGILGTSQSHRLI